MSNTPAAPLRRIITSHSPTDTTGSSVLLLDDSIPLHPILNSTAYITPIFSHLGCPTTSNHATSQGDITAAMKAVQRVVLDNGVNAQITELKPGVLVGMHRTSSVDYNVLIEGSVELIVPSTATPSDSSSDNEGVRTNTTGSKEVIDGGNQTSVTNEQAGTGSNGETRTWVYPGQIVVQRGTMHAWKAGPQGARWITIVISANPVVVGDQPGGKVLHDQDFQ